MSLWFFICESDFFHLLLSSIPFSSMQSIDFTQLIHRYKHWTLNASVNALFLYQYSRAPEILTIQESQEKFKNILLKNFGIRLLYGMHLERNKSQTIALALKWDLVSFPELLWLGFELVSYRYCKICLRLNVYWIEIIFVRLFCV